MARFALCLAAFVACAAVGPGLLAAGAPAKALLEFGSRPVTIVCFGDSVTGVYYHTGGRRAYPEMLEIALKKAHPEAAVTVINAGISGNTTQNGLDRLDRDVLAKKPDLVTVAFGLNDMTRFTPDQFRDNLKTIVARCREAKSQVVLCTPNAVLNTGGRPTKRLEEYCAMIRATAAEVDAPLCDLYAACDKLRARDAWAWRLTLSDAIHPNMDGHKLMAHELCRCIAGKDVSLDDVGPPVPALTKTFAKLKAGEAVRVLAMPPFDGLIGPALKQIDEAAKVEVTPWPTEGATLADLQKFAQEKVRAMKPDLVVLAVPRSAKADSDEAFVNSYTWIMNWSLSFGHQEWDVATIHPAVAVPGEKGPRDDLARRLVRAQHLHLVDRPEENAASAESLFVDWVRKQSPNQE